MYCPGPGVWKFSSWTNLRSVEPNTPFLPQVFFYIISATVGTWY
jgi:hypothetical protein